MYCVIGYNIRHLFAFHKHSKRCGPLLQFQRGLVGLYVCSLQVHAFTDITSASHRVVR